MLTSKSSFHYHSLSIDAGELSSLGQVRPLIEKVKMEDKVLFLHAHGIGDLGHYKECMDRLDGLFVMGKSWGWDS